MCIQCKEKNSQGEDFSKNVNQVATSIIDDSDKLTFFEKERHPIKAKFQQFLRVVQRDRTDDTTQRWSFRGQNHR